MNYSLFLIVFTLLSGIYLLCGMWSGGTIETEDDYFLAGRSLGLFPLVGTLVATQVGGGMILGSAAQAYTVGWHGLFYSAGIALGFVFLGSGLAGKLRGLNVATTAEIFEKYYGSPVLRKVASLLSIVVMCGLVVGQVVASHNLLTGLGLTSPVLFFSCWALVILYTMYGGLHAVVMTDIMQVLVIVLVFGALFSSFVYSSFFSSTLTSASLAIPTLSQVFYQACDLARSAPITGWSSFFLMPALFALIEQDLAQRFFAARTQRLASISALISAFCILLFAAIPVYFGVLARMSGVTVTAGSNPLITFLENNTSELGYIFVLCALIAAIVSTADSLLCAISSNVVQDFFPQSASHKSKIQASRITTVFAGVGALIGAFWASDIISVLTQSYELLISMLFVPIIACFFRENNSPQNTYAALLSVFCGGLSFFWFRYAPIPFHEIASLAVSLFGYILGAFFTEQSTKQSKDT